ncbi:MAG: c-type cytochrome [Gammaproteobacteria bacterium]
MRTSALLSRLYQLAALVLAIAALSEPAAAAPDERAPYVANGCYQCHGYAGQGGAGARLARTVYSFEAFSALVRRPANEMPAYAPQVLNDQALRSIYDYLRSLPEPPRIAIR